MLEVRYNTITNLITGWWGNRFGQHEVKLEGRPDEAIVELDIYIPPLPLHAYLYQPSSNTLIANPDYTPEYDYVARANEMLSHSPAYITAPEMWELLRIFGRILGCYSGDTGSP